MGVVAQADQSGLVNARFSVSHCVRAPWVTRGLRSRLGWRDFAAYGRDCLTRQGDPEWPAWNSHTETSTPDT